MLFRSSNRVSYPNITNPIASAAGNGYFEFQGLPVRAEAYKLMVSAEGYATEAIAGMTITYDTQALGPLTIQLAKDYGTVTGFVYLEVNGVPGYQSGSGGDTPISGISVTANETITSSGELGTELAFDRSKLDGSYKLDSLPTSNLYVVANSSNPIAGYSSFFQSYKVEKGINSGINIELTKTKGEITGTIFEDINKNGTFDNEPYIGGATVFVQQNGTTIASSISEANGAFKLTGLNADTFNIEVKMTGYKDTAKTITLTENSSVSNVFIAMYKPVGRLVGRVIDFDTPVPKKGIAGIKVSVLGESLLTAITDSNGTYVINNVPAASLQITSWNLIANGTELGYGSATTSVNAPQEGATQNVSDIELYSKTRQVWGKIVNSIDSVGIQGIKVKISGTSYEAVTDASGAYYFGSIPVNSQTNYNLIINDTIIENGIYRYRSRDDVSIVVADESATLKIQDITVIPNTGKIRGMVYDSLTGFPIKSSLFSDPIQAELTLPGITTPVTASVSQVNGEFVIDKIPSGSHNVKIKHAVTGSNLKMFEETSRISSVNAGQTTDLGIIYVTIKTITLRGYICDRVVNDKIGSNYYISGAMIQASINGIPYTKTSTTSYDGTYQMTVPAYSDYTIKVSSPNYMDSEETSLSLQLPGPFIKNFYINPRVGNISGTVYLDSNANYYYDMGDTVKIKVAHSKYMSGTFTVKTNYRGVPYSVMVDANSTFSFTNLPVGNYYITIDPPAAALDPAYAELNSTSWLEGPSGNRIVNVNNSSTTVINTVVVKTAYPTGSISGNKIGRAHV